jgi:hypothetical protein
MIQPLIKNLVFAGTSNLDQFSSLLFCEKNILFRVLIIVIKITIGDKNKMQHRRERIADRMKNLHDLIPNSNKVITAQRIE